VDCFSALPPSEQRHYLKISGKPEDPPTPVELESGKILTDSVRPNLK
jgi:hypothetical protein